MIRRLMAACVAALVLPAAVLAADAPARRQVGQLVYDNIPEGTAEIRESIRRYQNTRSAQFEDWLADGSMLITTRFGQTAQLHRVAAPGADRTQLTFFDEPVAGAVRHGKRPPKLSPLSRTNRSPTPGATSRRDGSS